MSKSKPKPDPTTDPQAFLSSLGLNPQAPNLATATPAAKPAREPGTSNVALVPAGMDPHTIAVADIVFDPALLDDFPDLTGEGMAAASRYIFGLYKSPRSATSRDRNSLLHVRVGQFLAQVRRERNTGGHVKEHIKTTKEHRDLAALLAARGIGAADLAALLDKS